MIYFLDGNQEVIKIVRSSAVISAIQTQELPEDNSLLRDYLSVRLKNDERLFNAQYMAIKSYGGNRNAFDLYRIASELVPDNATEFVGIQVAPYELEGVVIEDLRPQDRPLNQTMGQVLKGSDWRIGYVADNLPNVTTNFYYMSVKDALKQIQELLNVEMLFKVEISGNKITDKWVEVYHQLGNRTMKRFNYGTNALSVVRESSHDELYTALIGRGKGEEVGETESGDATYGRKINFADVEWKKSAGKPVDKPKGQKYIELPNATAEYGIKLLDGRKVPRIGIVDFSETEDPEVLIEQTYQELLVRARPKVLFKASVINTGDMLIGDTVTIHRHDLDFHYQARVRKVVRDRKNNNKTQVEIGDVVHTPSTKRQSNINSALNDVASDLENVRGEITEARSSADGKNTNFYGNVEPNRKKIGDTWFRDHPSLTGESQILVWNGEAWELIMDTSETTKNALEIEEAKGIAEAARDNTLNIAADLLEGTSFYKHTQNIGLASKHPDGTINSIINLGSDGTAYVGGKNIVLDGNTIVDGTFTITDKMIAPNAEIDGAKIQDATIGSAKIANLDVGKISGNTSNFVQTNWNSAIGGSVSISGNGIQTVMADSSEIRIAEGSLQFINRDNYFLGSLSPMYIDEYGVSGFGAFVSQHFPFVILRGEGAGKPYSMSAYFGLTVNRSNLLVEMEDGLDMKGTNISNVNVLDQVNTIRFRRGDSARIYSSSDYNHMVSDINGQTYIRTYGENRLQIGRSIIRTFEPLDLSGNHIHDVNVITGNRASMGSMVSRTYELELGANAYISSSSTKNLMSLNIDGQMYLRTFETDRLQIGRTIVRTFVDLDLNGNGILNQSDERLKRNIKETKVNSLEEIKSMYFVEFDRTNGKHDDIGIIAQYTPGLSIYNEETDTWNVDSSKQLMVVSHAVQQLDTKVDTIAKTNEDKIHELQQELSQANRKIKELEEQIA